MTDNTQELDEIIFSIHEHCSVNCPHTVTSEGGWLKDAILDWHNKQVEAVLDRLEAEAVENVNLVKIIGIRHIEAERNLLTAQPAKSVNSESILPAKSVNATNWEAHYPVPDYDNKDQDSLREQILFASDVTYAPYTKDDYKTEEIVKLPLKDLMSLISQDRAALLERVEKSIPQKMTRTAATVTRGWIDDEVIARDEVIDHMRKALNKLKESK